MDIIWPLSQMIGMVKHPCALWCISMAGTGRRRAHFAIREWCGGQRAGARFLSRLLHRLDIGAKWALGALSAAGMKRPMCVP